MLMLIFTLSSHSLMFKLQSVYRKFRSLKTTLSYVQNDILAVLDTGHYSALLLFDPSAGFVSNDH